MSDPIERPPSLLALPSYLAARVAKGLRSEIQRALAQHGLETPQHGVLVALDDFGVLAQQQLADRLETDKSHVLRLIDQLEGRGMLTRSPDPTDRRRHRVELTPTGRKVLGQATTAIGRAERDYLSALSDAERRSLTTLLQQVLDSHDQAPSVRMGKDVS
jgi:DNA-binding MarR family transcriptional regulator